MADVTTAPPVTEAAVPVAGGRHRLRTMLARVGTGLAFAVVWIALIAPDRPDQLGPAALVRIPVEGLLLVALGLALPARPRRVSAALLGLLLGLLAVVKILDVGFYEELDRPFNPVIDYSSIGPAIGVLRDSIGRGWTNVAVVGAVLIVAVVIGAVTVSMLRVSRIVAGHRRTSLRAVGSLGLVWLVCAALGVQLVPGAPVASRSATALTVEQIRNTRAALADQQRFSNALASFDPAGRIPTGQLLSGLRGKDVIIAFVESYGDVAVQDSSFSPGVDAVLSSGTQTLASAGFGTRSAFLDSPTFGGISWLAHSTLQSGLWVNNQQRYNQLVASNRYTLSDAFSRAGWRTVGDVPSNTEPWPQGSSFYHYDQLYDEHNVGYAGPKFSYASMPDQYTLAAFQRMELAGGHPPVMAEIDLVSSHTPWTPLPRMVDPAKIGDGSIFDPMPAQGPTPSALWQNAGQVRASYGQSIQYSLTALVSFVTNAHDDNLVLVLLGDHQPATIVSGSHASHRVPITIVAHDPSVLQRIAGWGWTDGMQPSRTAPVWPMSAFRDRFLKAYSAPVVGH
jgi:hypothetical protein